MGNEVTMSEALIVTVVSMLVVFLVLILISYIIGLLKNFAAGKKPAAVKPEQVSAAVIKQEEKTPNTPELDEGELIAVIAAAVAASLGRDIPEIRINSIRRVPQLTTPWREMGKQEQLLSKL
jgi:sodium pump decarboxylase gamma subunit